MRASSQQHGVNEMNDKIDRAVKRISSQFLNALNARCGVQIDMHVSESMKVIELRYSPEQPIDRVHIEQVIEHYENMFGVEVSQTSILATRQVITLHLPGPATGPAGYETLCAIIEGRRNHLQ